ncbi:MAG: YggU family protein [Legionellaceae bacterium]|nr:YggU family protein [Legionellaceae bacterium]MBP9776114.1 YggU family protein [Legionellaceae bacterium]
MNASWYTQTEDVIVLKIYVQPGAKHNEIVGLYNNALKIRVATPAIDGRANVALLKYIAELFEVSRREIILKRGDTSRYKSIEVRNSRVNPDHLLK